MSIIKYLDFFLGALINLMCYIIIMKKVFNAKVNSNNKKVYISLIICSILTAIINVQNRNMFKPLFIVPIFSIGVKYITNQNLSKSFFMTLSAMFYLFLSEIIVALIASIFKVPSFLLLNSIFGSVIGNILVAIFAIPFIYIFPIKKYLNYFIDWFEREKNLGLLIIILMFLGTLASRNAYNINNPFEIITNIIIIITFIIIIALFFSEYQKQKEISNNYNMLFSYLKVYELELIEKRKIIHDYNNELIIINSYAHKNNIKLKKYIKSIINEQRQITENIITKNSDKIPSGLKGLVCYKLSSISKDIHLELNIIEKVKNSTIPDFLLKDSLKITGILLDNAIEAANLSMEKKISIIIETTKESIKINFINSFDGKINIDEIYNSGYSTKGLRRGYGLSLVKDIIKKNKKIKVATKIIGNNFSATQIIQIK